MLKICLKNLKEVKYYKVIQVTAISSSSKSKGVLFTAQVSTY